MVDRALVDRGLAYWTEMIAVGTWVLLIVTGWFMSKQIGTQREAQRVRLTVIRRDRYESEEMQRYRRLLAEQLRSLPSSKTLSHFDPAVPNFFDITGALLRKKYLAKDLVRSFFGYAAKRYWHALKPTLQHDHDGHPNENLWCDFEYLINEVGGSPPTDDEMRAFWEEETRLQPYLFEPETRSVKTHRLR